MNGTDSGHTCDLWQNKSLSKRPHRPFQGMWSVQDEPVLKYYLISRGINSPLWPKFTLIVPHQIQLKPKLRLLEQQKRFNPEIYQTGISGLKLVTVTIFAIDWEEEDELLAFEFKFWFIARTILSNQVENKSLWDARYIKIITVMYNTPLKSNYYPVT